MIKVRQTRAWNLKPEDIIYEPSFQKFYVVDTIQGSYQGEAAYAEPYDEFEIWVTEITFSLNIATFPATINLDEMTGESEPWYLQYPHTGVKDVNREFLVVEG